MRLLDLPAANEIHLLKPLKMFQCYGGTGKMLSVGTVALEVRRFGRGAGMCALSRALFTVSEDVPVQP